MKELLLQKDRERISAAERMSINIQLILSTAWQILHKFPWPIALGVPANPESQYISRQTTDSTLNSKHISLDHCRQDQQSVKSHAHVLQFKSIGRSQCFIPNDTTLSMERENPHHYHRHHHHHHHRRQSKEHLIEVRTKRVPRKGRGKGRHGICQKFYTPRFSG